MNANVSEYMHHCGLSNELVCPRDQKHWLDAVIDALRSARMMTSFAVHQHLGRHETLYLTDNALKVLKEAGIVGPDGNVVDPVEHDADDDDGQPYKQIIRDAISMFDNHSPGDVVATYLRDALEEAEASTKNQ